MASGTTNSGKKVRFKNLYDSTNLKSLQEMRKERMDQLTNMLYQRSKPIEPKIPEMYQGPNSHSFG